MRKFQVWWIKFGCFLTGHDFYLLSNCSQVAVRKVKKYTAALVIISIIWAFVGYTFCERYIKLGPFGCIIGALLAVVLVIQIERQILMNDKTNNGIAWARACIAVLMAVIGSLVIDQIIFKDDIDRAKLQTNQQQVNDLLPLRSSELIRQVKSLDAAIASKEDERNILVSDINKNQMIRYVETSTSQVPTTTVTNDTLQGRSSTTVMRNAKTVNTKLIPNPKIAQLAPLDSQISALRQQKAKKDSDLLDLQALVEKEVGDKVGFLDELRVMFKILSDSSIALAVYVIWFLLLLFLELLILMSKKGDLDSDYEIMIRHQMEIHNRKIRLLMAIDT